MFCFSFDRYSHSVDRYIDPDDGYNDLVMACILILHGDGYTDSMFTGHGYMLNDPDHDKYSDTM